MPHHAPLIATIVAGFVLAFILGAIANRLRLSPVVGYLLAGVATGPFTPGFVADQSLASQLAEIGVILLMFGVGMHFSLKDLLSVRAIAIPGAIVQIGVATLLGMGMAWLLDWTMPMGFVFGLALSVASTVVLVRAMQDRRMLDTEQGRIAIGWLIVEDLVMVLALVLLPAMADFVNGGRDGAVFEWQPFLETLAITLGKVAAFVVFMLVVGRRVVPWILHYTAHTGSRELFRLAVLSIALGIAYGAAMLFDVSFALGAFFAGMILSESELSHQAAEESLPLRDAFAVLFFVSVGMLFDPNILVDNPLPVIGTIVIILFGKSLAAFLIVLIFRHPLGTALTISASLAQIGEFSFILAALGLDLGLMSQEGQDLVLAGAMLSILLNPIFFSLIDRLRPGLEPAAAGEAAVVAPAHRETVLSGHLVLIGYGRVGGMAATGLRDDDAPLLVVEERQEYAAKARNEGFEVITANAAQPGVLKAAGVDRARSLLVAIPNAFEAGQIVLQARGLSPSLDIVARAHSDAEVEHLMGHGASLVIMGEREIARAMVQRIKGTAPH